MEVITLQSEVWKTLKNSIDTIFNYLTVAAENNYDDLWLNNHEVCDYLHISKRTLYRMRKKGEISYAKNHGQYFYTIGEIKRLLQARTTLSNAAYMDDLIEKSKHHIEKGRLLKNPAL